MRAASDSQHHVNLDPAEPAGPRTLEARMRLGVQAVTGDQSGTISVWHVPSGKLRFRFYRVHGNSRLTALNFDTNKRRLVTGARVV